MTKARDLGDFISDGTIAETVTADGLDLGDNERIRLGDSQDLQILHNGLHSYIADSGTGNLYIQTTAGLIVQNSAGTETLATFTENSSVDLYHDNSVKLATSSTGATVTGTIAVSGDFNATSGTFTVQSNGTDILNVTSTEMTPQTDGAISLGSATNGFNNMYLDGSAYVSGNVGIGTSSPSSYWANADDLVVATSGNTGISVVSGTTSLGYLIFADSTAGGDNTRGGLGYDHSTNDMLFRVNNDSKMRLDASGNLLVGTTDDAPGAGDTNTGVSFRAGGDGFFSKDSSYGARFNRNTNDGDVVTFAKDGSTVGSIGANNGNIKVSAFGEEYAALSGTTPTVDCRSGNNFALSTTGNTTFTFSNPPTSGTAFGFTLKITAGGTHTLIWPSSVDWPGGTAPDAPASGETNVLVFITQDGGTTWYGFQAGAALA